MDKIKKFINKLSPKEKNTLISKIKQLENREIKGLDIKKIKDSGYFRLRSGNIRLIFYYKNGDFVIEAVGSRNSTTYKNINKRKQ
ncbi:hypothetical protein KAR28_01320 [Candidatus Parcubacteria bacterium]|nr:hypothetical protein [Candidatus Parcubacteria bacterium]